MIAEGSQTTRPGAQSNASAYRLVITGAGFAKGPKSPTTLLFLRYDRAHMPAAIGLTPACGMCTKQNAYDHALQRPSTIRVPTVAATSGNWEICTLCA
ncbi:unnamed protein product [Toxocara canis]|uniref:IPT/TIG domain-containing protein n=1 Tax=Toxocara canis TaxID=6265 RepID=A0A183UBQ9_TOXCA|nr:unnamed protein product [Toxocara canis]